MPEIKNNFIQGKMNKDLDDRLLPNGQYRNAQNIIITKSDDSDVGVLQNVKGNLLPYPDTVNIITQYRDFFQKWKLTPAFVIEIELDYKVLHVTHGKKIT